MCFPGPGSSQSDDATRRPGEAVGVGMSEDEVDSPARFGSVLTACKGRTLSLVANFTISLPASACARIRGSSS